VVTGGSRGIGRAAALELACCGADVIFTFYRRHSAAREVVQSIEGMGRRCLAIKADFNEESDVRRLFDTARAEMGHLDFYVNNAASAFFKTLSDLQPFHWEYVIQTNLTSTLVGCREAYRMMPDGHGAIVLLSSLGSRHYLDRYGALGACKAAIESLGRSLAVELAPGVNVNTVCGGVVDTESVRAITARDKLELGRLLDRSPMRRLGKPRDLAKVIAFLCSDDAAWIRGQTLIVDGGLSLTL
jgi:enoyl-[acyl-carrier protein] reductase III